MGDKATDKPLCKICDPERRHRRGEPHVFGNAEKPKAEPGEITANVGSTYVALHSAAPQPIPDGAVTFSAGSAGPTQEPAALVAVHGVSLAEESAMLEAYKTAERAKVLARVHKHRAKKASQ